MVFLFCQYKIHELNARVASYTEWEPHVEETRFELMELLGNCYAEDIKL